MIVSHAYRFVFLHVPKTGGISITAALKGVLEKPPDARTLHKTWDQSYADIRKLPGYTTAAFVRNPWERFVSLYRVGGESREDFGGFVDRVLVRSELALPFAVLDQASWALPCSFVGRFERLEPDFAEFCELVGLSPRPALQHLNKGPRGAPWTESYRSHPETVAIVGAHSARDVTEWGYRAPRL